MEKSLSKVDMVNFDGGTSNIDFELKSNALKFKCGKKLNFGFLLIAALLLLTAIILFAVAFSRSTKSCSETENASKEKLTQENFCSYSSEAKRVGLPQFMLKLEEKYFEMFPEDISWNANNPDEEKANRFRMHDPKPTNIKRITDNAKLLLQEAIDMNPDFDKLKPHELKSYLQAKHFFENTFGYNYLNYTAGLWMMGPTTFCYEPICYFQYSLYNAIAIRPPKSEADLVRIIKHIKSVNQTIIDYIDVLKMGIEKGMVRTVIECQGGINAFKDMHKEVSLEGISGLKEAWYSKKFYKSSYYKDVVQFNSLSKYGNNVTSFIINLLEKYVGNSIISLIRYLEEDHILYCRPNNVGPGGLSALPIDYVYYKGNKTTNKTDPYLELCGRTENCRLNGSKSYASILGFFTTKDISPDDVHELGWKNLNTLYPQLEQIAEQVTKEENITQAKLKFDNVLSNLSVSYFNKAPIPANESNAEAFKKCTSLEKAKLYCPKRWQAMMDWFSFAQKAMSMHDPNTVDFFFFTGEKKTTPDCPVRLAPDFVPTSGAQSYMGSDINCTTPATYFIPFFLDNVGPVYSEYSVNAHEARPGHHTQVQGQVELFAYKCGKGEALLNERSYYTAFTEGWALYAENPLIAQSTNVYENEPMQKYGMLKWQIWRALRLIVDTGLHYKGFTRQQALDLFEKYAWDKTDLREKEVTRYQSNFGQATAYMVGQLDIWELRNKTQSMLGKNYSLKEFHLQALSQGSSPLAYLSHHIEKYIECKKNSSLKYCDIILNPTGVKRSTPMNSQNELIAARKRRHHF